MAHYSHSFASSRPVVPPGHPLIEVEGLHKSFGSLKVLKGITTTIKKGEVVVVIGPSGGGKSTFLRCLNLLEEPTEGKIWFGGEEIVSGGAEQRNEAGETARSSLTPRERERNRNRYRSDMGMVFQHFNLFAHLTVLENITLAPRLIRKVAPDEAEARAMELLKRVGLAEKANAYPAQLSGGQKQRIAIVRSLAMQPRVMLFDEPTSALDPEMVGEVLQVMRDLAAEHMTMITVTHELSFAREIASRMLFIDGGNLAVDAPTPEFFGNISNRRLKDFISKVL